MLGETFALVVRDLRRWYRTPGQIILVFPRTKRYIKLPARGRLYEELVRMTTPAGMVNYFTAKPYTNLGRSRVGDVEAEGFEASHMDFSLLPDYIRYLFPIQNLSCCDYPAASKSDILLTDRPCRERKAGRIGRS